MQRFTSITLLILAIALTSMSSKEEVPATEFQKKVDSFLNKYSANYTPIAERFQSGCNDFILENKVKNVWDSTVTLKSRTSFKNKYDQNIYQQLFLGFYQYDTDKQCSVALDSLLHCFGSDCGEIKWGENGKTLKTTPAIYLIRGNEIVVCKIHCEHENDFWGVFKDDIIATFGRGAYRILETGCGGPVRFWEL
jgi:hypothetical protein